MIRSAFKFSNPRINKSIFISNDEIKGFDEKKYSMNIEANTEIKKKPNIPSAIVRLTMTINKDEKNIYENKLPFFIEVAAIAEFSWNEQLEERGIDSFLQMNAPALLLSYIRSQVAYITTQAGFPALNIPFMDFTQQK